MTVHNVTVADTRFLLREVGEGPGTPVLLLHGVPETSSIWRDVAPALAEGRRVLCPDLPGLGGSAYSGPYDMPSVVGQVVALLDAQLPGQRVDVVGHDWGGVVAFALAGARPDLVRRLAVANAPYRSINLLRAFHIPLFNVPAAPEVAFRLAGARIVELMLSLGWKARDVELDPVARAEYVAAYSEPAQVSAMLGYYRAAARPRIKAALTRSEPTGLPRVAAEKVLVLWGAADPALPISLAESAVRDLGSATVLVTVPGAGHFVIEEAPELVIATLRDFLAEAPDAPAPKPARKRPAKKA